MLKPKIYLPFIFIFIIVALSYYFLTQINSKSGEQFIAATQPEPKSRLTPSSINISEDISLTSPKISSQISPDGNFILTMKTTPLDDKTEYSFSFKSKNDPSEKELFVTNRNNNQKFSLPFNAWSPDNKYIFIQENIGSKAKYYVLSISPDKNSNPENIFDLFTQIHSDFIPTEITGWAAPNLLIINSINTNNHGKTSFWYNVTNQNFTQLYTVFD